MSSPVNQHAPAKVDGLRRRVGFWLRNDASRLLWPGHCLACGERAGDAIELCPDCLDTLPWLGPACLHCALPLPAQPAGVEACGQCLATPPPLAEVHAACLYAPPIDTLLPRFKFHQDLAAGKLLAQLLAERCAALPGPDALVPVPLHHGRLRQRGYDQALELARPLAIARGVPLRPGFLHRVRETGQQSRLDARARAANLRDAFIATLPPQPPGHVVLVDDVMTTGATLHAAARALHAAGVRRVDAWVCARAP